MGSVVAGLAIRSRQEEQMDAPDLDPAVYEQVLHDLARVNRWTFTAWPTVAFLRRAIGPARRFRLLDVGFGDGDVLRAVARWARRRHIDAELVGVDINENSGRAARNATPADLTIDYRAGDYLDQAGPFDFIISSQVTHHMTDAQLMTFLRHMEAQARLGWLICTFTGTASLIGAFLCWRDCCAFTGSCGRMGNCRLRVPFGSPTGRNCSRRQE